MWVLSEAHLSCRSLCFSLKHPLAAFGFQLHNTSNTDFQRALLAESYHQEQLKTDLHKGLAGQN